MGKPGLGLFTGRRKSQSNVLDDVAAAPASPDAAAPPPPAHDAGGFRLMSRQEVSATAERRKTMEKEKKSAFPRFSGFGSGASKARNHSVDDESPASSKRDSKSSSGTQFSTSRPYINGHHGSTSTLPSSTDTGSDDNLFANVPRPQLAQHGSSPGSYFSSKKSLPALPRSSSGVAPNNSSAMPFAFGKRDRAMTTSSYASTAMPPKLDQDLSFGEDSSFDDVFTGLSRKPSPDMLRQPEAPGRSLLAEKRTFQPEPIKVLPQNHVEPPLRSWDSRGSADNLMDSPRSDNDSPPAPPLHKYQQYAPVSMAPESPDLQSSATFQDRNGHAAREPFMHRATDSSPEPQPTSISTSSANSFETPLSSRSASTSATPRAPLPPSAIAYDDDDEDNMFAPPPHKQPKPSPAPRPAPRPAPAVQNPPRPAAAGASRVMSQAEFRDYQMKRAAAPPPEESDSEEDYEDEEDAIKKREDEEVLRRKNQQMSFAREAMRRSTTAPGDPNRPESIIDNAFNPSMGFPSETSMKADEWEDEDVPLGILQQHGFPSAARSRLPTQPANAIPSYFPDRPASAGAMGGNRGSTLPAFARRLPMDPHDSFIGGGLVHHANRESLGFNNFPRGPQSVAGDAMGGGYGQGTPPPLMYQDAGLAAPSLVDQIQMRDMTKKKYLGGASTKKPVEGPFTGMLGQQMNAQGQVLNPTRMSQMPMMNGMNGMNGMSGMNGMNPMMMSGGISPGQMPMMGMGQMGQMGFMPQQQQDFMQMQFQYQQMQQMMAMQQMQMQQMQQQQQQQQQQQDPRMSMAMPNNMFNNGMMGQGQNMMGNNSFLSVPGMQNGMQPPQNRPMSIMSSQRPFSSLGGLNNGLAMGPGPGYTPSIAPSERSNIGLSARYRPVTNHSDAVSNATSMTLQATSGGANKPAAIKGILKKSPQLPVEEKDDEEDWGSMAARKSKFGKGKENASDGLEDLTRGLNI